MPASCVACGHKMHGSLCDAPTTTTLRSGPVASRCGCESRAMTPAGNADEIARLRRKLLALGLSYRRRREHHARECADLYGYGAFVGPCAHGRDPWDRCDECGEGTALAAAANAVAAAWLRERDLERLLGDALPWVEHGTDSCACGESGCDHRARLVARIAAALAAGARKDGT